MYEEVLYIHVVKYTCICFYHFYEKYKNEKHNKVNKKKYRKNNQ